MGTLGEEAKSFVPTEKLNIADLDVVTVDMDIQLLNGTDSEGKEYTYRAYVDGNKEYYVSNAVIVKIQEILKLKPTVTKFGITKTGAGLGTKYKVEALD